jgi:hypothetical protein
MFFSIKLGAWVLRDYETNIYGIWFCGSEDIPMNDRLCCRGSSGINLSNDPLQSFLPFTPNI